MTDDKKASYLVDTYEATEILFGSKERPEYQRLLRWCKEDKIEHLRDGKKIWFNRVALTRVANNSHRKQSNGSSPGKPIQLKDVKTADVVDGPKVFRESN